MSRERRLRLIERFYEEMWNRFDASVMPEILEPTIRFRGSLGQDKEGYEELADYLEYVEAFAPDFHNRVEFTLTEGDRTFARLTFTGTHRGEIFGIRPTGRRFEYAGAAVFDVPGERIASVWVLGESKACWRSSETDPAEAPPACPGAPAPLSPASSAVSRRPPPPEPRAWCGNLRARPGVREARDTVEGRPLDDGELVRRARDGDLGAYEELVRRHQQIAQRVAYLVAGSVPDAQDATQEAFVKAYRALDRFREDAGFRPWLLRIVRNEAHNRRRRSSRQARLALRVAEDPASGDAAPSPEAAVLAGREREALLRAVEELPEAHRLVVACRFFLGLSVAETARVLGVAEGTVKSRLHRALGRLREGLPEELRREDHPDG